MHWTRRRLLLSGASVCGVSLLGTARGKGIWSPHKGPYLLTIQCDGGWDPLMFCDPTGSSDFNRITDQIAYAGSIPYSPIDPEADGLDFDDIDGVMSNQDFFETHSDRLLVLNGVRTDTISHYQGRLRSWTGGIVAGYPTPTLGALFAGTQAPDLPLAFLSMGGIEHTAGLVPLSRFSGADDLDTILHPYWNKRGDAFNTDAVRTQLDEARQARSAALDASLARQRDRDFLVEYEKVISDLHALYDFSLEDVGDVLPPDLEDEAEGIRLMMAAFASGLAAAGNLQTGSFDTHGSDHDTVAPAEAARVWRLVDWAVTEAARVGVAEQLVILLGSDFGRGPAYNSSDGKGHAQTTSFLIHSPLIEGNRVVGGRDKSGDALAVDPDNLTLSDAGEIMTPGTVHAAMRRLLSLDTADNLAAYPIDAPDVYLFG